ncbi:MFS transporter [Herbaspirillum aquaticum]|uniref:MFS transporter n=3 Tax=Pseudomonadota TaxID=1224 RepID=A0A225STF0_9BURK|nr:MFS transporter [Herbaspirillum aquaticum]OWY34441.1 MFS transporter [Herbaspirillum aquaticum]
MNPSQSSPAANQVLTSAVSKIKWRILPLFVAMFIINYIDRVNIGFVRSHLSTDLGIGAAAFGLGAGLFFVGYAIFEVPSNMLLQRYGARAWLTRIMFTWGLVAACMAFVHSETSFYFMRFLLGVTEAGFFPGVVYYFTQWLPNHERGRAMAVFLSGSAIASILSGPITGALLLIEGGGLHGWQWMFIIEGGASMLFCVVVWMVLDSTPRDAKWLSPEQREALVTVIAAEQEQRAANRPPHVSALTLLRDPQIVLFCLIYFAIQLTIYGATFWLPTIIKKMGHFNDFQVGLFNSIPWIVAIAAMYVFAVLAARYKKPQFWVATTLVISAAGMAISASAGPVIGFVAVCFAGIGFKAASSLFWPIPQAYLDARIAAAVLALINSLGNLGGFFAPATFGYLEQKTGSIQGGLYALSAASLVAAVLVFLARTRPSVQDGDGSAEGRTEPLAKHAL